MRTVTLPLPLFGFAVATRAALGVGLGLILADKLSPERRRRLGSALIAFGAVTTVPAARWLSRSLSHRRHTNQVGYDPRLIGMTRFPRRGDDDY